MHRSAPLWRTLLALAARPTAPGAPYPRLELVLSALRAWRARIVEGAILLEPPEPSSNVIVGVLDQPGFMATSPNTAVALGFQEAVARDVQVAFYDKSARYIAQCRVKRASPSWIMVDPPQLSYGLPGAPLGLKANGEELEGYGACSAATSIIALKAALESRAKLLLLTHYYSTRLPRITAHVAVLPPRLKQEIEVKLELRVGRARGNGWERVSLEEVEAALSEAVEALRR